MDRTKRLFLCGLVFAFALVIELALIMALPFHISNELFEQFLWISFAFVFIPLILAGALLLGIGWLLIMLALVPARALWRATSRQEESPSSVGAQLRARDAYLKRLRAERARANN